MEPDSSSGVERVADGRSARSASRSERREELVCTLTTPAGIAGAIAIIQVHGDVGRALARLGMAPLEPGRVAVRNLLGVDRGVVARVSDSCLQLMPHGGTAVVRELLGALGARGVALGEVSARALFPEAADEVEAEMLVALGRAASPLAVDLLLDQPRRWRGVGLTGEASPSRLAPAVLDRLLHPPLVVGVGAANIGKSTLLNSLARRSVAIVADEPGTTRDHLGVMLDVGGLVVRYIDTPGLREGAGESERRAREVAMEVARRADLLLLFADASSAWPDPSLFATSAEGAQSTALVLKVGLRGDLGRVVGSDQSVAAIRGEGLAELAGAIRARLVPAEALADPRPWRFW